MTKLAIIFDPVVWKYSDFFQDPKLRYQESLDLGGS